MRDLSLHILDLAENSVRAGAKNIHIGLVLDEKGLLKLTIQDDGCGMSEEMVQHAFSPFMTSRTTRKVGLGIPLINQNCHKAGGNVVIKSSQGVGTLLTATMDTRSIDCLPLGDIAGTLVALIVTHPHKIDFSLHCVTPLGEMNFDTTQVRQILGDSIPLDHHKVTAWMLQSMREEIQPIFGGVIL